MSPHPGEITPAVVDAAPAPDASGGIRPTPLRRRLLPDIAGLLVSCLVVVVAYAPVLFGGRTLSAAGKYTPGTNGFAPFPGQPPADYSSDFRLDQGASVWQFEPWAEVTGRALAAGEIPLWNPYQAAGAPHAANMQTAVFDPLLLAVNLHPTPLMWDLSIIGAFVLGAAAAYLFGRILGLNVVAAVVTSAAFSLSGWFFLYSNNTFSRSYVFLPLVFLLVELALRSRRLLPLLGLSVAVAGSIYAGMPEATFFVAVAVIAYAALRIVQTRATTPVSLSVARLAGAGLLGVLLASPLVIPFLEYEALSQNLHKPGFQRGADADPAWGLLHWIVPWFPNAPEPPAGPRSWFGVAIAISALVAVSGRAETRRLHAWFFLVLGAAFLVKIYDFRVLEWVGRLPVFELVVFPWFAPPIASFAFAVLAGIGVQVLWSRDLQWRRFLMLAAAGSLALVILVVVHSDGSWRTIVEESPMVWIRTAAFAALAFGAIAIAWRFRRPWLAVLLASVIVFELFWHTPFQIYAKRADPFATPTWMAYVRAAQGDQPSSRVFALDGKLYPNTAAAHGLQDVRAIDALYVRRYLRYVETFIAPGVVDRFTGEETPARFLGNPMFDALAVRTFLAQRDLAGEPGLTFVGRDGKTRVYENRRAYPRAWVVHEINVVDGEDEAFAFLRARARRVDDLFVVNTFDPRREAVVEGDASTDPALRMLESRSACTAPGRDRATIERYAAGSVTLRVRAACAGLLVLPDTHYPGWSATVNGRKETIYATNAAFRGVRVPAGTSRVEFRYEPRSFSLGIAAALAGLVALAVIGLVSWRRRAHAGSNRVGSLVRGDERGPRDAR